MKASLALPILLALGAGACRQSAAAEPSPVPPGQVWLNADEVTKRGITLAPVSEQGLEGTLVTGARVTFDDLRVAHIYTPVSGRVTQIDAQLGERVQKGATLAVIASPDLGTAVADLRKGEADLIAADHVWKREKNLSLEGAGTKSDLEAAEDAYRQAKAERDRANQKVQLLHGGGVDAVHQTYTVTSPIEGEVIMRNVNPGIEVQGQYGGNVVNELFTVGELDRVWVFADIYEADLGRVHEGAGCNVRTVAYKDKTFEGHIDWVAGVLDPSTRTARVRCAFDNPNHELRPEMYATAYLAVEKREELAVPRAAVSQPGGQSVVFVKVGEADGRVHYERLPVAVDDVGSDQWLVVLHGLDAGQMVVTAGADSLTADL